MKTSIVTFIALSVVILFPGTACKKNETSVAETTNPGMQKSPGEIHNELLNLFVSQPSFPALSGETAFTVAGKHFAETINTSTGLEMNIAYTERMKNPSGRTQADMLGKYNANLFSQLYSTATASGFFQKAIAIEAQIKADKQLTETQRIVYTGTLSVLKNSLLYWEAAVKNETHPWHATLLKYVDIKNSQPLGNLLGGSCVSSFNPYDPMPFTTCLAVVDALNYEDAYWYIFNGSNHEYANTQATAQSSYASGVAAGLGMHVN